MNESGDGLGRDIFVLRQRLLESQMARDESDRLKERLHDTAAATLAELRIARQRIDVLEAHVRRLERENESLIERVPSDLALAAGTREMLVRAQAELVAAHETSTECELLIDSLQLQLVELRVELARARGFDSLVSGS